MERRDTVTQLSLAIDGVPIEKAHTVEITCTVKDVAVLGSGLKMLKSKLLEQEALGQNLGRAIEEADTMIKSLEQPIDIEVNTVAPTWEETHEAVTGPR